MATANALPADVLVIILNCVLVGEGPLRVLGLRGLSRAWRVAVTEVLKSETCAARGHTHAADEYPPHRIPRPMKLLYSSDCAATFAELQDPIRCGVGYELDVEDPNVVALAALRHGAHDWYNEYYHTVGVPKQKPFDMLIHAVLGGRKTTVWALKRSAASVLSMEERAVFATVDLLCCPHADMTEGAQHRLYRTMHGQFVTREAHMYLLGAMTPVSDAIAAATHNVLGAVNYRTERRYHECCLAGAHHTGNLVALHYLRIAMDTAHFVTTLTRIEAGDYPMQGLYRGLVHRVIRHLSPMFENGWFPYRQHPIVGRDARMAGEWTHVLEEAKQQLKQAYAAQHPHSTSSEK